MTSNETGETTFHDLPPLVLPPQASPPVDKPSWSRRRTLAVGAGTFVVADGNGGYVTAEIQTGQVSAASATSITVVSSDGYTRSYTVGSSTVAGNGSGTITS